MPKTSHPAGDASESHLSARPTKSTVQIQLVNETTLKAFVREQGKTQKAWLDSIGFRGKPGEIGLMPGAAGRLTQVVFGIADITDVWAYAALPAALPKKHSYAIANELSAEAADAAALGWALGCYRFQRYRKKRTPLATLVWPKKADSARVTILVEAITLCRDLVNTPASDMGPSELVLAGRAIAKQHHAKVQVLAGEQLLSENYPLIHAVGRASTREPMLFDLRWGHEKHKKLTLVGKGVCFDTGGLDLKPANDMKLMKKDMGGAAAVLALAHIVMSLKLPVRLRVLIPAVENSVAGNAFRPLDVIRSRKGITVEVGNTDAEGRLVLADALAEADTEDPDLIIDMATLTGAARVALGTALPALFSTDDEAAEATLAAGQRTQDPLWRLPLHEPYRKALDSKTADINNITGDGYGGAITAALFMREFISKGRRWMHVDTMAYNLESKPGRPAGGEAFAVRALAAMLARRYAP